MRAYRCATIVLGTVSVVLRIQSKWIKVTGLLPRNGDRDESARQGRLRNRGGKEEGQKGEKEI